MYILIDNKNGTPIYDQIYTQIKNQILSGELEPDSALPSIRALARSCAFPSSPPSGPMRSWKRTAFSIPSPPRGAMWPPGTRSCCGKKI